MSTPPLIIIPAKSPRLGKSRLHLPAGWSRPLMAQSFLRDTCDAARVSGCPVAVLTSDEAVASWARRRSIEVLADREGQLNGALATALAVEPSRPVMVLMGDLPCVTAADLRTIQLALAQYPVVTVRDRHGSGTTCVAAREARSLPVVWGRGSAQALEAAGVVAVSTHERLRCDVDTWDDLVRASSLGVGRHTRRALRGADMRQGQAVGLPCPHP